MKHIPKLLVALLLLTGCGADSLLPWLTQDYAVPCNRDWLGEWLVSMDDSDRQYRVVVELREEPQRDDLRVKERYAVQVWSPNGQRKASLNAHLFNVNGVQLLMLGNFSRPDEQELASVISYSLWRAEGDAENLMLWIPEFVTDMLKSKLEPPIKVVKAGHEMEQPIFVDSTEALQSFVESWTRAYEESNTMMPFCLHRPGKPFQKPSEGMRRH
jgi:hypothetical protein